MSQNPTITEGIHHAGLTVPDLDATRAFFVDALGFEQIGAIPDYPAVFLSDGVVMLTLWQAADPTRAVAFDRRNNIGLHHFALKVRRLDDVHNRLAARADVALEFAPENLGDGPTRHMMCTIPGGIRVEFIEPATA